MFPQIGVWLAGQPARLPGWLVGRSVGWLVGWLAALLGRLAGVWDRLSGAVVVIVGSAPKTRPRRAPVNCDRQNKQKGLTV